MPWYRYFPPSRPREAKGGIKAHSKRGEFGASWWAKRWNAVLEGFRLGARLARGRSYARRGQVLDIDIEKGVVTAEVQGSRPRPYDVTIRVKTLPSAGWQRVAKVLSAEARFTAKLLSSEMPQDIETAFAEARISLFPERSDDLRTECSCPDWSNPCKHIAAVYYLLGEEFDRDPFLIFKLRGMSREELVRLLGGPTRPGATRGAAPAPEDDVAPSAEPLSLDAADFWSGAGLGEDPFGEVRVPDVPAALLLRLGKFPFWRAHASLLEALEPVYVQASPRGLGAFLGERGAAGSRRAG